MEPQVGMGVWFYRDKDFPGKRGPWSAKITEVMPQHTGPCRVNVQVIGAEGGVFTEKNIPYLTGQFEDPGTRYATEVREKLVGKPDS